MKLRNITEVDEFLETADQCEGAVWLESPDGDKINLKSKLSQYFAIAELLGAEGDYLELFCAKREDEARFLKFFKDNPGVL